MVSPSVTVMVASSFTVAVLAAATGAEFSLTITLIISPPFPFLALTLNQLFVPPEKLDTVALSIDVLISASSSKYSPPSSNTLPPV